MPRESHAAEKGCARTLSAPRGSNGTNRRRPSKESSRDAAGGFAETASFTRPPPSVSVIFVITSAYIETHTAPARLATQVRPDSPPVLFGECRKARGYAACSLHNDAGQRDWAVRGKVIAMFGRPLQAAACEEQER